MKTRLILITAAFLLVTLSPLLSAQDAYRVDPFYQTRLDEGRTLFLQGDFSGAVQNIEIAYFGFLDNPDKLLECYVYLSLGHGEMKSWERAEYYRNEIRRLKLGERLPNLDLPAAVKARYDEINGAFTRVEASSAGRMAATPPLTTRTPTSQQLTAPASPNIPAKMDVEKAAPLILQARAEKNLSKKIAFYKQALIYDPTDLNTWFEMNDAYFQAKKYRAGADLMEALLLSYPDNIRVLIKLAEHNLADKSYKKALPTLFQAAGITPENIEVRYLLGRAYFGLKRYTEAAAEFDYVLSLAPAYGEAQSLRQVCTAKIRS